MILAFAIASMILAAVLAAFAIGFGVLIACGLVRHCRAERARAEFDACADQVIALTGLWSDEENEILLGRRPFQ